MPLRELWQRMREVFGPDVLPPLDGHDKIQPQFSKIGGSRDVPCPLSGQLLGVFALSLRVLAEEAEVGETVMLETGVVNSADLVMGAATCRLLTSLRSSPSDRKRRPWSAPSVNVDDIGVRTFSSPSSRPPNKLVHWSRAAADPARVNGFARPVENLTGKRSAPQRPHAQLSAGASPTASHSRSSSYDREGAFALSGSIARGGDRPSSASLHVQGTRIDVEEGNPLLIETHHGNRASSVSAINSGRATSQQDHPSTSHEQSRKLATGMPSPGLSRPLRQPLGSGRRCQSSRKNTPEKKPEIAPPPPEMRPSEPPKCPRNIGGRRRSQGNKKKTPDTKDKRAPGPFAFAGRGACQTLEPMPTPLMVSTQKDSQEAFCRLGGPGEGTACALAEPGSAMELFLRHRRTELRLASSTTSVCMEHDLST